MGWVYQYALVDKTGKQRLAELRSFQDWYLRYWLQTFPASPRWPPSAAFKNSTRSTSNPNALLAYNIPLTKVVEAVRDGNNDVGGRLVEIRGAEYMVRGRGYVKVV